MLALAGWLLILTMQMRPKPRLASTVTTASCAARDGISSVRLICSTGNKATGCTRQTTSTQALRWQPVDLTCLRPNGASAHPSWMPDSGYLNTLEYTLWHTVCCVVLAAVQVKHNSDCGALR